ncbi:hypothetical protein JW826_02930 [Candidatus Woesearchaeota archaeon]|nr:hypothetical protein [Candidatus Woesearchaeota archaeon]
MGDAKDGSQKPPKRTERMVSANPACMVCGSPSEYCMRGIPKNTYCRGCAENYFELLEYLDHLGK